LSQPVDLDSASPHNRRGVHSKPRVGVVTGGLRGIGKACALALAEAGTTVAIFDLDIPGSAVQAEIESVVVQHDVQFFYRQVDVTAPAAIAKAMAELIESYERVDILVNNVGVGAPPVPIEDLPLEQWQQVIALNLTSTFLCTRAVVPAMKAKGRGSIINISSQAGRSKSEIGNLPYATAKAGILGFTRQLANELGPFGIRVNAVAPGLTLNERVAKRLETLQEDRRAALTATVPLGRLGDPVEIAAVVAFLASDASSYITGATIDVNGGRFMM
jgi:3-oxoacyl-[acyl-carrier protein] reductase